MAEVVVKLPSPESWLHIYRNASPAIGLTDKGPYDEYLDLNNLEVNGEWTLVHIKSIRDGSPTEYHGKLILSTLAISCKRIKFGYPYVGDFHDAEGRIPMQETITSFAKFERLAIGRAPSASSPNAIYYRFACFGIKPQPEEVGWTIP